MVAPCFVASTYCVHRKRPPRRGIMFDGEAPLRRLYQLKPGKTTGMYSLPRARHHSNSSGRTSLNFLTTPSGVGGPPTHHGLRMSAAPISASIFANGTSGLLFVRQLGGTPI